MLGGGGEDREENKGVSIDYLAIIDGEYTEGSEEEEQQTLSFLNKGFVCV